jgi:predicted glycosyltransferase
MTDTQANTSTGTVIFQPPNKVGLGHISRLSAIAQALAGIGEFKTPFVIDSAFDLLLDILELPYLSIPNRRRFDVLNCWKPWGDGLKEISKALCSAIVEQLSPDLVVFDCIPHTDLALDCLRKKVPIALCLRPVRDGQLYLLRYGELLAYYNLIIVPDDRIDPDLELPAQARKRTFCVGPIARIRPYSPKLSEAKRRVVISGGGGGFPGTVEFYNLAVRAVSSLRQRMPALDAIVILGPLFLEWDRLELPEGVKILPFTPNPLDYFSASDLVVCQGGYNTVIDLGMIETPAIIVPAVRFLDDQFKRARMAAESQAGIQVFETGDHDELARMMERAIVNPVKRTLQPAPPGAARAAELIAKLVRDRRERQPKQIFSTQSGGTDPSSGPSFSPQ